MSAEQTHQSVQGFWKRAVRLAQVVLLVGAVVLYFAGGRALALGFVAGTGVSVLRFHLRYRALMRGRSAGALVRLRLLTYALSAAALGLAFWLPHLFSPWSTAPGLLVMNVCIIVAELTFSGADDRAAGSVGS